MWKSPLYFGLQYNLHESVLRSHLAGSPQSRKSFLFAERFLHVHGQCLPLAASPEDQGEAFACLRRKSVFAKYNKCLIQNAVQYSHVYHLKYIPLKQTWMLHKRAGVFQGYKYDIRVK